MSGHIRIVGNTGENLRMDARSWAAVDADPTRPGVQVDGSLRYAPGDRHAERRPAVTAVAHAGTRTYVIDRATDSLATLDGTRGLLNTVGSLGIRIGGPVQLAVSPRSGIAYMATVPVGGLATLYTIDLASGRASSAGYIGDASFAMRALSVAK